MGEKSSLIHLVVDGDYKTACLEKTVTRHDNEANMDIVGLKVIIDGAEYMTPDNHYYMEGAVHALQKALPVNVKIACCQTCRHGNFDPFGDWDDKIYCLVNHNPNNKIDVCDIIVLDNAATDNLLPRYELLHWCDKYKRINMDEHYTYNDWEYYWGSSQEC